MHSATMPCPSRTPWLPASLAGCGPAGGARPWMGVAPRPAPLVHDPSARRTDAPPPSTADDVRPDATRDEPTGDEPTGDDPTGDRARGRADLAIVRAALAGDETARETLVERFATLPARMRRRHRRLGAPLGADGIEDAIQNTLLSMWRKLGRFDGRVPVDRWALGFGVLEILKLVEILRRRRECSGLPADLRAPAGPAAGDDSPLLLTGRLAAAFAALSDDDREILRLKHFEDRTFVDIAARLNMLTATVKTRYYRAVERLRRRCEGGLE